MYSQRISVLAILFQIFQIIGSSKVKLCLLEINDCENYQPAEDGVKITHELQKSDFGSSLTGSMDFDFDIDSTSKFSINASTWSKEDNIWTSFMSASGYSCDVFAVIPKLWGRVAEAANVSKTCPIKAGHYELKDFVPDHEDVDFPLMLEGKFRLEIQLYKEENSVSCQLLTLEGKADS